MGEKRHFEDKFEIIPGWAHIELRNAQSHDGASTHSASHPVA